MEEEYNIDDVINTRICIDMRGDHTWGKRVMKLRKILKAAAPKSRRDPRTPIYNLDPFYYVKNGEWYASRWERYKPVCPLKILITKTAE